MRQLPGACGFDMLCNVRQVLIDIGGAVAVADQLGVDVALVRSWAKTGHIPQTWFACKVAALAGVEVAALAGPRDLYPRATPATLRRYTSPAADLVYQHGGPYRVAADLGLTVRAVTRWIAAGRIPSSSADAFAARYSLQIADMVASGACD